MGDVERAVLLRRIVPLEEVACVVRLLHRAKLLWWRGQGNEGGARDRVRGRDEGEGRKRGRGGVGRHGGGRGGEGGKGGEVCVEDGHGGREGP